MDVRQWLMSYRKLVMLRNQILMERQTTWDRLTSTTQSLSADVVSSTKNPHKFDAYAELEGSLVAIEERCIIRQKEISDAISMVEDELLQAVLISRYINFRTQQQTAEEMCYSTKQIQRLQAQGIKAIKDVLECPH